MTKAGLRETLTHAHTSCGDGSAYVEMVLLMLAVRCRWARSLVFALLLLCCDAVCADDDVMHYVALLLCI